MSSLHQSKPSKPAGEQLLERLPTEGDSVESAGFRFTVARMLGRQVQTVMISPLNARKATNTGKSTPEE